MAANAYPLGRFSIALKEFASLVKIMLGLDLFEFLLLLATKLLQLAV